MEKLIRVPRPMGTTSLMLEFEKTQDPKLRDLVITNYINHWITHQSNICGITLNVVELAHYLGVDVSRVHEQLSNQLLNNKIFNPGIATELTSKLIGQGIAWALEDRLDVQSQVDILRKSQGGKYVPFISSEVTKAIALKIGSTNSLQALVKQLQGGSTVNIFNQQNSNVQNNTAQQVTIEDAVMIIQNQLAESSIRPIAVIEQSIEVEHIQIPEVVATRQGTTNFDATKEGLNLSKSKLQKITNDYNGALIESEDLHHDIRREIELGVDLEEVDPETIIY